jgi:ankyrin repeat protein
MEALVRLDGAVNAQNREGWTPTHWAASRGDLAAVELLLRAGGNPSVQAKDGRTALHWAAHGGHRAVFDALSLSGGDAALRDDEGNTAATLIARGLLKATSEMNRENEDSDEDQGPRHELDTASALDPSEEKLATKAWTSMKETWKNSIRRRK